MRFFARLFLLLSIPCVFSFAQESSTIVGTITDPSGAVIPAAKVVATEAGTGYTRSAATNTEGYYVIPSLRAVDYQIAVEASGFRNYSRSGITLQANQSLTVNVTLEIGSAAETVTVAAAAAQVDTTTGTLKQVVDQARIVELPLNGRNAAQLTLLVPGVVSTSTAGFDQGPAKTYPGIVTVSVNGARGNQISYLVDGGNNNDLYTNVNLPFPFPDALQEFSVQTSNFSAAYGQNAGGVVSVVTKSGTNEAHGNAFGFLRNSVFNARNSFVSRRDQLKRSQYGGTLGGPVYLPKLYNGKDRTFFFFGYQGTRLRNKRGGSSAFLPTQANIDGDFSAILDAANPNNPLGSSVQVKDPLTGQPFPGNLVPKSRFDPASLGVLSYLPSVGGSGQVFYTSPIIQGFDEAVTRIDHEFSASDRLAYRWTDHTFDNSPMFDKSNILIYRDGSHIHPQNHLLHLLHIFRPNLLNDFHFTYMRELAKRGPAAGVPNVRDFGVQNIFQPDEKAINGLNVDGFFSFGDNPRAKFIRNSFSLSDDIRWVVGRHSIAFGGYVERSRMDVANLYLQPGYFTFSGDITGYALADFLLGRIREFRQGFGEYYNARNTFMGLYAEDNFRISRQLTLTAGLRFEPAFPWREVRGRIEQFRPDYYQAGKVSSVYTNAPPGLLFPGDSDFPANGERDNWKKFSPRVGFAYDVFGNAKTSIRGGSGVFFDTREMATNNDDFTSQSPFSPQLDITNPAGPFSNPLLGIPNPFPAPFPPPKDAVFPAPVTADTYDTKKLISPVLYNWNLAIEQQVTAGWLVRAAYVGSHGSHIRELVQLNPAIYIPGSALGPDERRLFPGYSRITLFSYAGNSSYNSLQLSVEKRLAKGFTVLGNYTWSKSLDNMDTDDGLGVEGGTTLPWYMPNSRAMDTGPSTWDRSHRLVVSGVWHTPLLQHSPRWTRAALADWQFSGIFTAQTGAPLTILAGQDLSQTASGLDRALLVGPAYGSGACRNAAPCVDYLNPASFDLPAVGTFGNVGKSSLRGPGSLNTDLGLFKNFSVTERCNVQFRAEFFNVFNRVNLGDPETYVSSGGFGRIQSANDPRIGQLGLKISF